MAGKMNFLTGIRFKILLIFLWLTAFIILLIIFLTSTSITFTPWLWTGAILFTVAALGLTGAFLVTQVSKPIAQLENSIEKIQKEKKSLSPEEMPVGEIGKVTRSFGLAMERLKAFEDAAQTKRPVNLKTDTIWATTIKEFDFSRKTSIATTIAEDPEILHHPKRIEKIFLERINKILSPKTLYLLKRGTEGRFYLDYHIGDDPKIISDNRDKPFIMNDIQRGILSSRKEEIKTINEKKKLNMIKPFLLEIIPETVITSSININDKPDQLLFCLFETTPCINESVTKDLENLLNEYRDIVHLLDTFRKHCQSPEVLGSSYADVWEERMNHKKGYAAKIAAACRATAENLKMSPADIFTVERAAYLMDIGTVGISRQIERDEKERTTATRKLFSRHPALGISLIKALENRKKTLDIIQAHHEHFDGNGFPFGLAGENIPLGARILSIASNYYSLREKLIHLSLSQIRDKMKDTDQYSFDPKVLDAFLGILPKLEHDAVWTSSKK